MRPSKQQTRSASAIEPQPEQSLKTAGPVADRKIRTDDISERAYAIYLESGCQEGRCERNWCQAERELRQTPDEGVGMKATSAATSARDADRVHASPRH